MTTLIKIFDEQITAKELFCKLLKHFNSEHSNMLEVLRELAKELKNETFNITEMVDVGCLLKGIEEIIDEIRKDVKAHRVMIGKATCYQLSLEDRTFHKGTLATGSIKVSHYANIPHPKHEPEKFARVCSWFGIDVGTAPDGVIRFHWPEMKKYITACIERGEELPPDLSDVKVDLEMTYRKKV